MTDARVFRDYINELNVSLSRGNATEHTHRPALKTLLEAIQDGIVATNEPRRIECGAPDYSVAHNGMTIGYIEAKDIGISLDAIERDSNGKNPSTQNGVQFKRYRAALANLILTNYTEFRWYVNGIRRGVITLADDNGSGKLTTNIDGISKIDEMLSAFFAESPEPISNPEELAQRMARPTRMIRDIVRQAFDSGRASTDVNGLYEATKQTLVDNLSIDDFADMFAQTLAYGLFAARINSSTNSFHWSTAARAIPTANPFLRQVFNLTAGLNAESEPFIGFVDDLSQLLANSDMATVLSNFGRRGARQDPIMHFYETFLAAYDSDLREQRGVYYTPEPVISYIVRSVDWLLRERFGCPDGLADYQQTDYQVNEQVDGEEKQVTKRSHRVLVLDPACGTGSFLYAVIDQIREQYRSSGNLGMWNGYVKEHLLPRIFGFELMMAPYAMAHLKLGMQLAAQDMPEEHRAEWDYSFDDGERLGIYLTNSLEQAEQQAVGLFGPMRVIADEANAAAEIKRDLPIMVVLGNPPYSDVSSNNGRWITELIEDYKYVDGQRLDERRYNLQDDYVKFIRFGQWRIQQSGSGVLAFITNHSYLDNPTFRGMRQQLLDTFTDIYLLDLHGNVNKKEQTPDGGTDQNVFDIRQGVAIAIFVKEPGKSEQARVHHADMYGLREDKYNLLSSSDIASTNWERLTPNSPYYWFKTWDETLKEEYEKWPKITEVMPVRCVGVKTSRDKITIQFSTDEVLQTVNDFRELSIGEIRRKYNIAKESNNWSIRQAQSDLKRNEVKPSLVQRIVYRPFDIRHTYYTGVSSGFISRPLYKVMRHMLRREDAGLITTRQTKDPWDILATDTLVAHKALASYDASSLFPLYIYPSEQEIAQGLYPPDHREPNLSPAFTEDMAQRLGLRFIPDGMGDLQSEFGPEDVFHYIYAVFHAPAYRERYDQFLRADFPRVPLTDDLELFRALVNLGGELTAVHLLKPLNQNDDQLNFPVRGDNIVEKAHPKYYAPGDIPDGETTPIERGRVYIGKSGKRPVKQGQYFDGVSPEVWASRIGGYQPMDKWLKDRKGKMLTVGDIDHYRKIAAALEATMRLTGEIDEAVMDAGMFAIAKPPLRVKPNHSGFVEGVETVRLNQLLADLDTEEFLASNKANITPSPDAMSLEAAYGSVEPMEMPEDFNEITAIAKQAKAEKTAQELNDAWTS